MVPIWHSLNAYVETPPIPSNESEGEQPIYLNQPVFDQAESAGKFF